MPVPQGELYHSVEHCLASNFAEGCAIGGGLSVIVSVLPALLKGKVRQAGQNIATIGNVRVALFFGSLMSVYNGGQYLSRSARVEHDRKLRLLLGFLSGLSVAVLPKGVRRFLVYFLLSRSIEVAARLARTSKRRRALRAMPLSDFTEVPTPDTIPESKDDLFSSHEVVGLTSFSMTVIITAWFRYTHVVPKGYLQFLVGINNLSPKTVTDLQRILLSDMSFSPEVSKVVLRQERMCSVVHPAGESCSRFLLSFLMQGIVTRTGPFYLKLYMLPLLFSIAKRRGKNISSDLFINFAKRVWWSSLFLSTMNATVAGTVCAFGHLRPLSYHPAIPLASHAGFGGTLCALSLYLEQDNRRLELALYLFSQAIQIMVNAYEAMGWWSPPGMDIVGCASSVALMTYAFAEQADLAPRADIPIIRPGYIGMMSRMLDTTVNRHTLRLGLI